MSEVICCGINTVAVRKRIIVTREGYLVDADKVAAVGSLIRFG
jgi:hypothetical protein